MGKGPHVDKYFHTLIGSDESHPKRSTLYDKPEPKECQHKEKVELYNVAEDSIMVKCKECGKRLDDKLPKV